MRLKREETEMMMVNRFWWYADDRGDFVNETLGIQEREDEKHGKIKGNM